MNYQEIQTEAQEIAEAVISEVDTYGGDAEELIVCYSFWFFIV